MAKKEAKKTIFQYRCKRACLVGERKYDEDEIASFDVNVTIPPHHFDPIDGGPVGEPPRSARLAERQTQEERRKAARDKENADMNDPVTFSEMNKTAQAAAKAAIAKQSREHG
jgi:hypothetical protein